MEAMDSFSPLMLTASAFGVVVVATTILGDFSLTNISETALRLAGVATIVAGLALA